MVSSHGTSGFRALLVGSAGSQVAKQMSCPAVVVRGSAHAGPVVVGIDTSEREHVVFPGALHREWLEARERQSVGLVYAADGDDRDWPAVRAWADRIAADLRAAVRS